MAREKTTITIDRQKLDRARRLTGASSGSEAVDIALSSLIRQEQLRSDIAAYAKRPATAEEIAMAGLPVDWSDLSDDTDWDELYRRERG